MPFSRSPRTGPGVAIGGATHREMHSRRRERGRKASELTRRETCTEPVPSPPHGAGSRAVSARGRQGTRGHAVMDLTGFVGPTLIAGAAAALGYLAARRRVRPAAVPVVLPGLPPAGAAGQALRDRVGGAESLEATLQALIQAIDARNPAARGHVRRVRAAALELGRGCGLDADALATLRLAALLHDVGTLMIPEQVLSKPGRLNDAEFEKVKTHPVAGVA